MRKAYYKLLLLFFFQLNFAQNFDLEIEKISKQIEVNNKIKIDYINILDSVVNQSNITNLKKIDSTLYKNTLIEKLENNSNSVSLTSFYLLCELNISDVKKILLDNLNNQTPIEFNFDDFYITKLGDAYIPVLIAKLRKSNSENLTKYIEYIEKLILHDVSSNSCYKNGLIKKLEENNDNYELIRKIVTEKKFPESLIKLAKYQNKNDLSIILSYFENEDTESYGLLAIEKFPDSSLYNSVVKVFKKEWKEKYYNYPKWRTIFQTLTYFPDENETFILFNKTIDANNKYRRETLSRYLYRAIIKNPNPKFDSYIQKIKIDKNSYLFEEEMKLN